jgi:hypothetical protein
MIKWGRPILFKKSLFKSASLKTATLDGITESVLLFDFSATPVQGTSDLLFFFGSS